MTVPQVENPTQEVSNKEFNFRQIERAHAAEKQARLEAERQLAELRQASMQEEPEDESEPYVDHKKLKRKLEKFQESSQQQTQKQIDHAVKAAIVQRDNEHYVKSNPDFYQTLEHAQKLEDLDPDFADSILHMQPGFARDKLVYKAIKHMGLDKPAVKTPSVQEKIDANRRSPYYQPGGMGTSPHSLSSDFSQSGQKQAYEKMQALKKTLRI